MILGAASLLSAAQPRAAAAFAGRPLRCGQLLDAGALIFRKALHYQASSLRCDLQCVPQGACSDRHSRSILPAALVLLGQAYPSHHAPGVEVAGELALIL